MRTTEQDTTRSTPTRWRARSRDGEHGFTLIELMVVVALVAVLAFIAIPSFMSSKNKAVSDSEVNSVFAEFSVREEQFRLETGGYVATNATCPSTASRQLQSIASCTTGTPPPWPATLRFAPPQQQFRCAYQVATGVAGTAPTAPASSGLVFTAPATAWYAIIAECDMDGVAGAANNSWYAMVSNDSTLQIIRRGK